MREELASLLERREELERIVNGIQVRSRLASTASLSPTALAACHHSYSPTPAPTTAVPLLLLLLLLLLPTRSTAFSGVDKSASRLSYAALAYASHTSRHFTAYLSHTSTPRIPLGTSLSFARGLIWCTEL